jgi:Mrp family chromosome partitioning ATPase
MVARRNACKLSFGRRSIVAVASKGGVGKSTVVSTGAGASHPGSQGRHADADIYGPCGPA